MNEDQIIGAMEREIWEHDSQPMPRMDQLDPEQREACRAQATAAWNAAKAALADAGMVIVPREPTSEMLDAAGKTPGIQAINARISFMSLARNIPLPPEFSRPNSPLEQAWRAMIASAPNYRSEVDVIADSLHKTEKR